MIQFVTPVHEKGGTLVVNIPRGYEAAVMMLTERSRAKHNGYMTVKIDTPHRPRTTGWKSQNHHLRGHVRQLCDYTGYTMSEMMQLIKEDTPSWPVTYKDFRGEKRMVHVSEADISVEVASEAIEICHLYAAENGCKLRETSE